MWSDGAERRNAMVTITVNGRPIQAQNGANVLTCALENGVYVLACDQCGCGTIGESLAVDPLGVTLARAGEGEELLAVRTDTDRIREARSKVASFDQRRPDLYRI